MAAETKAMKLLTAELRRRRWHPVRIEDKSSTGTPDLNFHVQSLYGQYRDRIPHDVWVELKAATVEASGLISITLRPAQYAWIAGAINAGRNVWLVFRCGPRWWATKHLPSIKRMRKLFYLPPQIDAQGFDTVSELLDFISV